MESVNSSMFNEADRLVLAELATMSDHGNSPVEVAKLKGGQREMVARLLSLDSAQLKELEISLWGQDGFI